MWLWWRTYLGSDLSCLVKRMIGSESLKRYHRTSTKKLRIRLFKGIEMIQLRKRIMILSMILFSFVSIFSGELLLLDSLATKNEEKIAKEKLEYFRSMEKGDKGIGFTHFLKKNKDYQIPYQMIKKDATYFPIADLDSITYGNSWGGERNFGGKRRHEGCDLMSQSNIRGEIPVFSMSDGIVENKGWLTLGGWRIGIRSNNGVYFYYAHLDSYAHNLEVGQKVYAGQLLGFMGDSGYGEEGTVGQFDVHLHLGIYLQGEMLLQGEDKKYQEEISINPYWILKDLEEESEKGNQT